VIARVVNMDQPANPASTAQVARADAAAQAARVEAAAQATHVDAAAKAADVTNAAHMDAAAKTSRMPTKAATATARLGCACEQARCQQGRRQNCRWSFHDIAPLSNGIVRAIGRSARLRSFR
jgi:hypothetical protein